jgi:peptidyl-prolyl cis-trans isomerase SurA
MQPIKHSLVLFAVALTLGVNARAELVDRVAAIVNKDIIALSEVEKRAAPELDRLAAERNLTTRATKRNEIIKETLNLLISEKLMDNEVKESNIDVTSADIDAAVEDVKRMNNFDDEKLAAAVAREGFNLRTYRDLVRGQVARLKLVQLKVRSRVKVQEEDLKAEYEKYKRMESEDPELVARHIVIGVEENASPEAQERAHQRAIAIAREARQPGVDFGQLAKAKSEGSSASSGGDLGPFRRGVMLPEFEKVAFHLKVGEISDPVKTKFGWHIIKLDEIRQVPVKPFAEVKDSLRQRLTNSQLERLTQSYVAELRQNAVVDVKI